MHLPKICPCFTAFLLCLTLSACTGSGGSRSGLSDDLGLDLESLGSLATGTYIQIYVETEDDITTRIKIAEDVVEAIEPVLKERVAARFPSVKSWQIDSISIYSKSERMYWVESSSWTHEAYIEVALGFASEEAWSILEFCGEEVQAAIHNSSQ